VNADIDFLFGRKFILVFDNDLLCQKSYLRGHTLQKHIPKCFFLNHLPRTDTISHPFRSHIFLEQTQYLIFFDRTLLSISNMDFPVETLQTGLDGHVTAWLPVFTTFNFVAACSTRIYRDVAGVGELINFDPLYKNKYVTSAIPCLGAEATAWLAARDDGITSTVLGPTFKYPGAYTGAQTITINDITTQTLCCPS
jgi:hypothetical protein